MTALDPFDESIIEELNELLRVRCPHLTLFYEKTPSLRGKYSRKIGFNYKGDEVSHIDLDANLANEITILYSETVKESHEKKFQERKLNLCLRLLAGMIAASEGVGLSSVAVSPITLYTMVKYFDCTIQKVRGVNDDTSQCDTFAKCTKFMEQDEDSISIKTTPPDYVDMLKKVKKVISTGLNCDGLGGTRKRKRHRRLSCRFSKR
jgi:hypothetical protein